MRGVPRVGGAGDARAAVPSPRYVWTVARATSSARIARGCRASGFGSVSVGADTRSRTLENGPGVKKTITRCLNFVEPKSCSTSTAAFVRDWLPAAEGRLGQ